MKIRYIDSLGNEKVEITSKMPSYDKLRSFVDGPAQRFSFLVRNPKGGPHLRATMWVNEEGGLRNLPVNAIATKLCAEGAVLMRTRLIQNIRGNVIVTHA